MLTSDEAYQALQLVAAASGLGKQKVAKEYPGLQPYLLACYNPFKKYYYTKSSPGVGHAQFDSMTWQLLEGLSKRITSGYEGQDAINYHTSQMTENSAKLFNQILNKDMRIGMGAKTINRVFPNLVPVHDIMLAKIFDEHRLKYPCFSSPKIDGVRAIFKYGKFYSRSGHVYGGLEHLEEQLHNVIWPLDGELIVPGVTFDQGSGMIRSDNETPTAQFNLIEIPSYNRPFTERLMVMKDMHMFGPDIITVPHQRMDSLDEVMAYYQACRKLGYEGAVVKPYDYQYSGTRSYNWMKMKNVSTIDAVVTGIEEGKGKYVRQLGKVVISYNGKPVRVGSGFADHEREHYWKEPEDIIGHTIEVLFMEVTPDGSLRHPRFVRVRHDK